MCQLQNHGFFALSRWSKISHLFYISHRISNFCGFLCFLWRYAEKKKYALIFLKNDYLLISQSKPKEQKEIRLLYFVNSDSTAHIIINSARKANCSHLTFRLRSCILAQLNILALHSTYGAPAFLNSHSQQRKVKVTLDLL